jgi:hypothetical protein
LLHHLAQGLLGAGLRPLEISFWRLLLGGGAFALHALLSRRLKVKPHDAPYGLALVLIGFGTFYAAISLPLTGITGLYLLPAGLGLLLWLRSGNATPLRKLNVLLFISLALLLLASGQGGTGIPVALLLGISYAGAILFSRKLLTRYAPVTLYAATLPLAAMILLPLVTFAHKSPATWLELALFSLLSSYALYGLYYLVMRSLGANRDLCAASAEPVAASLTALMLFASLTPFSLLMAGVIAAALLTPLQAKRSGKREEVGAKKHRLRRRLGLPARKAALMRVGHTLPSQRLRVVTLPTNKLRDAQR